MEPVPPRPHTPVPRRRPGGREGSSFSAGSALGRAFRVFGSQILILVPLAAVFLALPTWLLVLQREAQMSYLRGGRYSETPGSWSFLDWFGGEMAVAAWLASWLLPLAFQAVVTFAVFQRLRGTPARYGSSIVEGLQRLPSVVGTSLLLGLVLWGPMIVLVLLLALARSPVLGSPFLYLLLMLVALAWAGYVLSRWFVAVQVAVVEKSGPVTALRRSASLTAGARGRIFGIVMLVYVLPIVLEQVLRAILLPQTLLTEGVSHADIYVDAGLNALFLGLQAVTAACVYHGLRQAKEGVGLDELLSVFS